MSECNFAFQHNYSKYTHFYKFSHHVSTGKSTVTLFCIFFYVAYFRLFFDSGTGSDVPPSGASLGFEDTGARVGLASRGAVAAGGLLTADRGLSGAVACGEGACCCTDGSTVAAAGVRDGVRLGVLMVCCDDCGVSLASLLRALLTSLAVAGLLTVAVIGSGTIDRLAPLRALVVNFGYTTDTGI